MDLLSFHLRICEFLLENISHLSFSIYHLSSLPPLCRHLARKFLKIWMQKTYGRIPPHKAKYLVTSKLKLMNKKLLELSTHRHMYMPLRGLFDVQVPLQQCAPTKGLRGMERGVVEFQEGVESPPAGRVSLQVCLETTLTVIFRG